MTSRALQSARNKLKRLELRQADALRKAALAKTDKSEDRWRSKARSLEPSIDSARERVYGVIQHEYDKGVGR